MPSCGDGEWEFDADAITTLRDWDLAARAELAGEVPPLNLDAAGWAARQMFKACQCLIDRDAGETVVRESLSFPSPASRDPSTDYSVDLLFRFLPDLLTITRRLAPGDALTRILESWAREWPLSSPGVSLSGAISLDSFIQQSALRRLYLDRLTALIAKDRTDHAEVRHWLRTDLAAYPELAPLIFEALQPAALSAPADSFGIPTSSS